MRRNFSLVACYSLKLTPCLLLVVKSLVARCKILSLLVAKDHSLSVAQFARYSLQKFLVAKYHLLLVPEVARCEKLLFTRCKICSLLVTSATSNE